MPAVTLSHGMADLVSYGNADRDTEQVPLFNLFSLLLCRGPCDAIFLVILDNKEILAVNKM